MCLCDCLMWFFFNGISLNVLPPTSCLLKLPQPTTSCSFVTFIINQHYNHLYYYYYYYYQHLLQYNITSTTTLTTTICLPSFRILLPLFCLLLYHSNTFNDDVLKMIRNNKLNKVVFLLFLNLFIFSLYIFYLFLIGLVKDFFFKFNIEKQPIWHWLKSV